MSKKVESVSYMQRPEDRHNPAFKDERRMAHYQMTLSMKPFYRAWNFLNLRFVLHTPVDELLDKHAQRTNSMKVVAMAFAGFYCGTLWLYFRYKRIHEAK